MTRHEPECYCHNLDDHLDSLPKSERPACTCDALRAAYRRGYNDHAASRQQAEAIYGPYKKPVPGNPSVVIDSSPHFIQHGKGENP